MNTITSDKLLLTDNESRQHILNFLDTVCSTLGPSGKNVLYGIKEGLPLITKDGVSIAETYTTRDVLAQSIITMLLEASYKTSLSVGDGTTTTLAIVRGFLTAYIECFTGKVDPIKFDKKKFDVLIEATIQELEKRKITVSLDNYLDIISKIAKISSNGDEMAANLLVEAYTLGGFHGEVNFIQVKNQSSFVVHSKGLSLDIVQEIPVSPSKTITLTDAKLLMIEGTIDSVNPVADAIVACKRSNIPLIIIAKEFSPSVKQNIYANVNRAGLKTYLFTLSVFGETRLQTLLDVSAMLTGNIANVYSTDFSTPQPLSSADFEKLPVLKEVNITASSMVVTDLDEEGTEWRLQEITAALELSEQDSVQWKQLATRVARLKGSVCTINVGGITTTEAKELYDRVEDAVYACKSSLKHGILPGGGSVLSSISNKLVGDNIKDFSTESIYANGLLAPLKTLIGSNSINTVDVDCIPEHKGIDCTTFTTCNLVEKGIFDSFESTKQALLNAASVFKMLVSVGYFIIDEPLNGKDS